MQLKDGHKGIRRHIYIKNLSRPIDWCRTKVHKLAPFARYGKKMLFFLMNNTITLKIEEYSPKPHCFKIKLKIYISWVGEIMHICKWWVPIDKLMPPPISLHPYYTLVFNSDKLHSTSSSDVCHEPYQFYSVCIFWISTCLTLN